MAQDLTKENPTAKSMPVCHDSDVGAARRSARHLAEGLGFEATAAEEIVLAVSELASNLVKHAHGGMLTLTPVTANGRAGIMIEASDQGPGVPDINEVLADGFSTTGSLGNGLGAVNRLMDEFDATSVPKVGTRIVCRKWIRERPCRAGPYPLDIGAASRPCYPNSDNGDAFVIKQGGESVLVGVIDGLGHGELAHHAALAAREYVESHFDLPLEGIFRGVDRACRGTRGVVMALARFDWRRDCLVSASVGNIEARVFPASRVNYFEVRRGIIGLNAPNPIVKENAWPVENMLVLHSDGLRTHWTWEEFPGLPGQPASETAQTLLLTLAKDDDDATVVVVRSARP